jgi:hypothetical protein
MFKTTEVIPSTKEDVCDVLYVPPFPAVFHGEYMSKKRLRISKGTSARLAMPIAARAFCIAYQLV